MSSSGCCAIRGAVRDFFLNIVQFELLRRSGEQCGMFFSIKVQVGLLCRSGEQCGVFLTLKSRSSCCADPGSSAECVARSPSEGGGGVCGQEAGWAGSSCHCKKGAAGWGVAGFSALVAQCQQKPRRHTQRNCTHGLFFIDVLPG
jgi:hypothetical protein